MPRTITAIAAALLLVGAGCASRPLRTTTDPVTTEPTTSAPATTAPAANAAAVTTAVTAATLHTLTTSVAVQGAGGVQVLGPSAFVAAHATANSDWSSVVEAVPHDGKTTLTVRNGRTGVQQSTRTVDGTWKVGAVDTSGTRAVLTEPDAPVAAKEIAPARGTTRLMVVALRGGDDRLVELTGNFAPEGFTSDAPSLALIEYLPADHPTRYRVRQLFDGTAVPQPAGSWQSKGPQPAGEEEMSGRSRTQVRTSDGTRLYTLYSEAQDGYAFVHALRLDFTGVHCVDLPGDLGLVDHPGALALANNDRLYVVSSTGKLAEITAELVNSDLNPPAVRRVLDLGVSATTAPALVVDGDVIHVTLGSKLVDVSIASWTVSPPIALPIAPTAIATTPGGLILASPDSLTETDGRGHVIASTSLDPTISTVRTITTR